MARKCQLLGTKTATGNNRPFSLKATKRKFRPNLFRKRVLNPLTGRVERMRLSAKAIRTLKKWAHEVQVEIPKVEKVQGEEPKKERVKKVKLTPKQKKELVAKEEAAKKEEKSPVDPEKNIEEKKEVAEKTLKKKK